MRPPMLLVYHLFLHEDKSGSRKSGLEGDYDRSLLDKKILVSHFPSRLLTVSPLFVK